MWQRSACARPTKQSRQRAGGRPQAHHLPKGCRGARQQAKERDLVFDRPGEPLSEARKRGCCEAEGEVFQSAIFIKSDDVPKLHGSVMSEVPRLETGLPSLKLCGAEAV